MLNSAETVVFPSPIEPPMIERWAIRGASSGCSLSSSAMFVSGPIGAIATGSGWSRSSRAISATAVSSTAADRRRARAASSRSRSLPWTSVARTIVPDERTGRPLRDGDVAAPERVQQPQGVLRALPHVGVATDRRHRQDVEFRTGHGQADRQGVVQARIAVDDDRQRMLDRPERRPTRCRGDRKRGRRRRGPMRPGPASRRSPGQSWSYG